MDTAIVIPAADISKNSDVMLEGLMWSIVSQGIHEEFPVIISFDGCHENFLEHFIVKYPFIHPVINKGNRSNFAGNANRGLRYAHQVLKTNAVVVNQDTILPRPELFRAITGPGVVSPQQVTVCELPVTQECLDKLNQIQPKEQVIQNHTKVTGFCIFLSKELMDKIGYFDEWYKATFEDDDICARALLAGFPVQTVSTCVHHYISKCDSYGGARLAINFSKFKYKWSIPLEISHEQCNEWISNNHEWIEEMRCN